MKKIEIISSLPKSSDRENIFLIGTHNGIFHCDEVVACAILCLLYGDYKSIQILRTRDKKLLSQCDICVDIGGGKFDHHQKGFNLSRENGILYASAGLVWKEFGKKLIEKYIGSYDIDVFFNTIDELVIIPVDQEDNCKQEQQHRFTFVSAFLPLFFNNRPIDFNNNFYKVLIATIKKLEKIITNNIDTSKYSYNIFFQNLKSRFGKVLGKLLVLKRSLGYKYFRNGILEIPSQTLDWKDISIKIGTINFVIFPYPDGGWAAQCVPPSLENKFSQRIPFPIEWAGKTDELPKISGISTATFCHNFRFFARADNKEDIIKMCKIATDLF